MSSSAHSALASLTANYTDSEPEEDDQEEELEGATEVKDGLDNLEDAPGSASPAADESNSRDAQSVSSAGDSTSGGASKANNPLGLVSYNDDLIDDDVVDDFDHNSDSLQEDSVGRTEDIAVDSSVSAMDEGGSKETGDLEDVSQDKEMVEGEDVTVLETKRVKLPPEAPGKCSSDLQDRFTKLCELKARQGYNMNVKIQSNKQFRNPSIYEKLIIMCNIDELGTNYPKDIYDPHIWDEASYYDELAKAQKTEMERREKERKDRTKVEFVSGTVKKITAAPPVSGSAPPTEGENKRKSKWDQKGVMPVFPAAISAPTVQPVVVQPPFTANASGTKGTVINAFGSLPKKSKM